MGRWARSVATPGRGRLKVMPISLLKGLLLENARRWKIDVVRFRWNLIRLESVDGSLVLDNSFFLEI